MFPYQKDIEEMLSKYDIVSNNHDQFNCQQRDGRMNNANDIFFSIPWLRMWIFIHTHGERHYFDAKFDNKMASIKRNDGRCIRGSLMYVKHFKDKVSSYKPFDEGEVLYAEGVTSIAPISLHAWNVIHNARHQLVMDSTWSIKHLDPQDVWYHGVIFDPEFFEDIWLRQKEQRGLTSLPYLKSGYSILTCHELLNGQFDEYPITLEDCWNAIESIVPFRIAAVNQNKAYKKLAA